ncbi:MAG: hypothetical protein IJ240_03770, partial [Clostridia bacterium]|nr:hypothetical protein [Clostridia bacterium]
MMNRRSILKRIWIPVLLAALALPTLPAFAYGSPDGEPLYRAKTIGESRLLTGPDGDTVLYLKKDLRIDILAVDPCYVYVRAKNREGYLYRSRLKDVKPYDPETTPPYGVEVFRYMTTAGMPTPILAEPDPTSEELITLYEGARFAIIGFEDGWAKVIFKRQWGWIEADRLTQLVQVRASVDEPGMSAPLAVYTSYYGIQDTEANIGRMANIGNCCEKLSAIVLQPGDT